MISEWESALGKLHRFVDKEKIRIHILYKRAGKSLDPSFGMNWNYSNKIDFSGGIVVSEDDISKILAEDGYLRLESKEQKDDFIKEELDNFFIEEEEIDKALMFFVSSSHESFVIVRRNADSCQEFIYPSKSSVVLKPSGNGNLQQ